MKKSINIGVIVFLLLQGCSGSENTENQAIVEPISEDTPINEPPEPNNPSPPEGNNPPPPPEGGNDIDRAIQIINDADDEKSLNILAGGQNLESCCCWCVCVCFFSRLIKYLFLIV